MDEVVGIQAVRAALREAPALARCLYLMKGRRDARYNELITLTASVTAQADVWAGSATQLPIFEFIHNNADDKTNFFSHRCEICICCFQFALNVQLQGDPFPTSSRHCLFEQEVR